MPNNFFGFKAFFKHIIDIDRIGFKSIKNINFFASTDLYDGSLLYFIKFSLSNNRLCINT
jgi:hypothetical protein